MRNDSEGHDQRLTIVLAGTREDWPGGARTLTPRPPSREPNGRTLWFGAELDPDGSQVWFRITVETVRRMQERTPGARGDRLIDALLAWMPPSPGCPPARHLTRDINRFEVRVSDDGDTWIEQ